MWIADTYPRSGLSDVKVSKAGMGVFGTSLYGVIGAKIERSNISPAINGTGKVSGLDLKSSCPRSQNSMGLVKTDHIIYMRYTNVFVCQTKGLLS